MHSNSDVHIHIHLYSHIYSQSFLRICLYLLIRANIEELLERFSEVICPDIITHFPCMLKRKNQFPNMQWVFFFYFTKQFISIRHTSKKSIQFYFTLFHFVRIIVPYYYPPMRIILNFFFLISKRYCEVAND